MAINNKHCLGRGLGALLGDDSLDLNIDDFSAEQKQAVKTLPINQLEAGKFQPRQTFDDEAINALTQSVKEKGILQPILVRKKNDKYEIIAGERRFRAAQKAGLTEVPVIEKNLADNEVLEVALVENIVRQNLTALEEAAGFDKLIKDFNYTQEKLSSVVGKSRSYIANTLRLLSLPEGVKLLLNNGNLSAGHARALIGLDGAEELAQKIVAEGLNVRQVEELAAKLKDSSPEPKKTPLKPKAQKIKDSELVEIEKGLSSRFGVKVQINNSKNGKGKIVLSYNNITELESLLEKFES